MLNEIFSDLWKNYRGRLLGSIFGLFIGVMFLILGFLQTIFLLICITAGFFLGNKLDKINFRQERANMIRRIARELVLQSLFQIDFAQVDCEAALNAAVEERSDKSAEKAKEYAQDVLNGVLANSEAIDARISEYAIDWTLERMPAVDRNILRVAVYEMFFAAEKLVPNVAINEAVEIAKIYGTDDTPRFINGVLGKMVRSDV